MDGVVEAAVTTTESPSVDLITRLQSVDRFMQRLSNIQTNLEQLAPYLRDRGNPNRVHAWSDLVARTRATFTMEHEREIFDSMLGEPRGYESCSNDGLTLFDDEMNDD